MPDLTGEDKHAVARWRLVLGSAGENHNLTFGDDGGELERIEELVGFLFETPEDGAGIGVDSPGRGGKRDSRGGREDSTMTVPSWVEQVRELFPRQAREILEKELIQRRGINELLQAPKILETIEPNVELVKTLLTHKSLLNSETRVLARNLINKVVSDIKEKLKVQVAKSLTGANRRDKHSPRKVFRNLDLKTTVRRNLHNYDVNRQRLIVDRLYFYAAERKLQPWHVIVTVDQSGSMLDSAIFSAIMASIFAELPAVQTSLILFDTQVVDLSGQVGQPVDVLLSIQLGGGTDITQALHYATQLTREPARTIVVLITDFYEGRPEEDLIRQTRMMYESGIRMIGLGALGYNARPQYNKSTARKLRKSGMDILVCTPEKLADCMAAIIRG
jgi:Mg-chelatase subunit ChlD